MEGAIWRMLWELLRRAPEHMRKLFYTDSLLEALAGLVWLQVVFGVTQLGVLVFGKLFPEYAWIGEEVFYYLGFLPVVVLYRVFIRNKGLSKTESERLDEKQNRLSRNEYWKGYWEAVRWHGESIGVVRTSLGSVVLYRVKGFYGNPYDITPVEGEEDIVDHERWKKLYRNFRKLSIGKDPKEVLEDL